MASTKMKYRKTSKGLQKNLKGLMDRVAQVEKPMLRADIPDFGPGDTVRVHVKIKEGEKERIQVYEGVVVGMSNRGSSRSCIVRKISHGVGVERIFVLSSPKVAKIEIVQEGKVRRAKLYYLRKLEGKAAKIERDIETGVQAAASAAATAEKAASSKKA
jgi:large subunit ribosomal protein L19